MKSGAAGKEEYPSRTYFELTACAKIKYVFGGGISVGSGKTNGLNAITVKLTLILAYRSCIIVYVSGTTIESKKDASIEGKIAPGCLQLLFIAINE